MEKMNEDRLVRIQWNILSSNRGLQDKSRVYENSILTATPVGGQAKSAKIICFFIGHSEICDQSFSNRKGAKKKLINFLVWPFRNLPNRLGDEIPQKNIFFRKFGG